MADDKKIKTVMVSSTARDLPEHRREVKDACLRQGMFPIMAERVFNQISSTPDLYPSPYMR
jgi:hypothetical protein